LPRFRLEVKRAKVLVRKERNMATTNGTGSGIRSGYYLNTARWHLEPVASDGATLPAGPGRWIRIPTAAAIALVPILGAAFVVFLPVIGIVLTLRAIAGEMVKALHGPAAELAATVSPGGFATGEAHFTGKRPENAGVEEKGPAARSEALEALAREIERRRNTGGRAAN
jgi:hypothetical protein